MTKNLDALALLQAEKACRDLVVSAAEAVDQQNYEALVAKFTENATLVRPSGPELSGRLEILASYQGKDPNRLTHHLICNQHVDVHPSGGAQSRCKVLLFTSDRQRASTLKGRLGDSAHQVGVIEDHLILTDEGWKIHQRRAWFELYTPN